MATILVTGGLGFIGSHTTVVLLQAGHEVIIIDNLSNASIEAKGHIGTVERIGMFYTTLIKFGNERVIIPNGPLFSDNIINYSQNTTRRDNIIVGIGYGSDLKKAKEILYRLAKECPTALQEPPAVVYVEELADSSVNLSLRIWSNTKNYLETRFYLIEQIKLTFDKEGIEIPFPQRDVHIISQ